MNLVELDIDTPVVSVDSKPTQSSKTLHVSVNYSGQMSLHPQSHPFTSFTQSSSVCVCVCVCVYLAPGFVILNTVNRQSDHLHSSFLKLIGELCGTGELSGADGSEVPWVGEQDSPST